MNNANNIIQPHATPVKMAAAIYCRVSSENQETEGTSLETQRAACLKYCQDHGYTVTHQFIETYTGLTLDRPKLNELRQLVRNEDIGGIVIYCLDRISRDPTHGVILFDELEKHEVKIEAVTEDIDNSQLGKLISYIRQYAANLEAEKLRERTGRGIKSRVFDKKKPVTYRAPYGYDWEKDYNRLAPNSDYPTVKLIIQWAIDGKSYDWIIAELKRRAIPSPSGLPDWNKHTISTILRNPVYAGMYHAFKSLAVLPAKKNGNSHRVKSSVRRLPQSEWHYIPEIEVIDPPITQGQRALLLDQLITRQKLSKRNSNRTYLLRGMVYCSTHHGDKGEPRRYHGRPKGKTFYYVCPVGGCDFPTYPGPALEDTVKTIINIILTVNYRPELDKNTKKALEKELGEIQGKYEKIIDSEAMLESRYMTGEVDPEVYQRLKLQYTAQKTWNREKQNDLLTKLSQLEHTEAGIKTLDELRLEYFDRIAWLPEAEWRKLLEKLNIRVRIPTRKELDDWGVFKSKIKSKAKHRGAGSAEVGSYIPVIGTKLKLFVDINLSIPVGNIPLPAPGRG